MTNNVYQVLDDIKAFLDTGAFTNTVSFGDISDVDLDKQLQQINDQLISKLPEDQQKDLQDMTSNMMNIMKNIAK